jgi:hypothetical protein
MLKLSVNFMRVNSVIQRVCLLAANSYQQLQLTPCP